jgi:CRP/FNR family transcriptional regulator, anaerobic regulatory protein
MPPELSLFFRKFVDFSDEELAEIFPFFHPKKIKKGDWLLVPGEVAQEIGFIQKGLFRNYFLVDGKESTRFLECEGNLITSIPSFTTRKPSIEYVQALENSELLVLSHKDLQKMYEISQRWERMVRILAGFCYNEQQERIYSLIAETAHHRYQNFCNSRPDLHQRVPQYIIANYLGISPETLSRIRKQ